MLKILAIVVFFLTTTLYAETSTRLAFYTENTEPLLILTAQTADGYSYKDGYCVPKARDQCVRSLCVQSNDRDCNQSCLQSAEKECKGPTNTQTRSYDRNLCIAQNKDQCVQLICVHSKDAACSTKCLMQAKSSCQ